MRRMFSALAVVALLGVAAAQAAPPTDKPEAAPKETAQAAPAAKAPDITPETANALGAMCEFLKAQPVMAFRAEVSQEQVYPKGQTVQVNRVLDVVLRRPDKLYARVTGDGRDRLFVYDGKTATRADLDKGVYAVLDAPATVDALLTMLEEKYGIVAPLSDILYADPCASLLDDVQVGDTLGDHLAAGKSCRHLLFTQKNADWQLWIENGKEPVPRKLVINDKEKMGWPQYAATFVRFDFHPRLSPGLFTYTPGKNMRRIDFLPVGAAQAGEK